MTMIHTPLGIALPVSDDWALAIADYDTERRLGGAAPRARKLYQAHLAQLSRGVDGGPYEQTKATLRSFIAAQAHWSDSTRRSHRNTYVGFFDFAVSEGLMADNPARRLPTVTPTPPKPRPASDVQVLQALTGANPRAQLMVQLADGLGLRATEIAHIHSRDIRNVGGRLLLTVHGKGNKDRTLPVPPVLAARLSELGEGWAFPSDRHPSGHLTPPYVSKLLSRALPDEATGHMLRHRFATNTYNDEGDVLLVSQMLGHSNPAITQGYILTDNLARMTRAIDRQARPYGLTG